MLARMWNDLRDTSGNHLSAIRVFHEMGIANAKILLKAGRVYGAKHDVFVNELRK